MKIRKCCQNCKHYECWEEEDGDYGCELVFEKEDILDVLCVKYNKINIPMFYDEWKAKLEENAQLKELLKQAETQIIAYKNNDTLPERAFYEKEVEELLGKIDEALQ